MPHRRKLLAWIEPQGDEGFLAAFVGEGAASARQPATQHCTSEDEARRWVEQRAAALDLEVEWISRSG